jgi:hypothetical protein
MHTRLQYHEASRATSLLLGFCKALPSTSSTSSFPQTSSSLPNLYSPALVLPTISAHHSKHSHPFTSSPQSRSHSHRLLSKSCNCDNRPSFTIILPARTATWACGNVGYLWWAERGFAVAKGRGGGVMCAAKASVKQMGRRRG